MYGKCALAVPLVAPVQQREEGAAGRVGVGLDGRPGLLADRDEGHAGRSTQALLRAGHEEVELPLLGPELDAPEGGDDVHDGHGAMGTRDAGRSARQG